MCRLFDEIVQLDRHWFRAHPERRHRCRWPDTGELKLYATRGGARLVMAIRHLGHGYLVYQPVIFQGMLPKDERSAAILFALAARHPAPIPKFSAMDVRLLATSRRELMRSSRRCSGCQRPGSVPTIAEPKPAISLTVVFDGEGKPALLCETCRAAATRRPDQRLSGDSPHWRGSLGTISAET
jgi:hypothetical protein